jgi:DNA topoisomerase-1
MSEKTIKNLVIVESPAKAKTIEKYLGSDYKVMSSIGHIRSIMKKASKGVEPIDTKNDFATQYEVDAEKKKIVAELKKAVANSQTVWLATDEDREGEAIAWHLCEVLKLNPLTTNRIVFHEITKNAILDAIKSPRHIDMDLVKAQQARQILDRLVGFELSPVVWRKVPGGKSAGRVQSPAVKLLVEKERDILDFASSSVFKISGEFLSGQSDTSISRHPELDSGSRQKNVTESDENNAWIPGQARNDTDIIKATLNQDFPDENAAQKFLESLADANFTVANIDKTDGTRNPLPPFTTSTLQQDANARLGMSARATMSLAQGLYQGGFITYMRTDSMNLSAQFQGAAGNFIENHFGKEYLKIRNFHTKSAGAQEAHEAIRPTDPSRETVPDSRAQKLYDLIRRRTLASQMASAKIERTSVVIDISDHKETFVAKGEVVLFDGFLKMYGSSKDEILPKLTVSDQLAAREIIAKQTFARPPARYTEGSLVKKLEELGIGRPSTYATIIDTIQTRGYAEKGDGEGEEREVIQLTLTPSSSHLLRGSSDAILDSRNKSENDDTYITRDIIREKSGSTKGKLLPTASGTVVTDFLNEHFTDIDDYDFTARIENELDEIADAKLEKTKMLRAFYDPFHKQIEGSDKIERSAVAGQRELGKDPKTGEPVYARVGRFGPMLQIGETTKTLPDGTEDKKYKPRFANFPKSARLETVTLDDALKMFELPRVVGTTETGEEIIANIGRFGPYIKIGALFVSIKPHSPFKITEVEARELYAAKLKADAEKNIADFGEIKVLNGRFGPYITDGAKNAKIPKDLDPKKLTEAEAKKILADAPERSSRGRGRFARKTATKKTTAKKSVARKNTARKTTAKKPVKRS